MRWRQFEVRLYDLTRVGFVSFWTWSVGLYASVLLFEPQPLKKIIGKLVRKAPRRKCARGSSDVTQNAYITFESGKVLGTGLARTRARLSQPISSYSNSIIRGDCGWWTCRHAARVMNDVLFRGSGGVCILNPTHRSARRGIFSDGVRRPLSHAVRHAASCLLNWSSGFAEGPWRNAWHCVPVVLTHRTEDLTPARQHCICVYRL